MKNTVIVTDTKLIHIGWSGIEHSWNTPADSPLNQFQIIAMYNAAAPFLDQLITNIIYI